MIRTIALSAALAVSAAASVAVPNVALASGGGDRVVRTGDCSGSAHWKLKVKSDDGQLEVEGEVDSNTSGQKWSWKIKDNGDVAAKGSASTAGRSGSFSVERRIADQTGSDKVVFKATYGGQTCTGRLTFG